jgi:hypothetical protein
MRHVLVGGRNRSADALRKPWALIDPVPGPRSGPGLISARSDSCWSVREHPAVERLAVAEMVRAHPRAAQLLLVELVATIGLSAGR